MQCPRPSFANIESNFDSLITSDSRVSLTFVLLANIAVLNCYNRALPINLNLSHKLASKKVLYLTSCEKGYSHVKFR